jgi:hypothetical protein
MTIIPLNIEEALSTILHGRVNLQYDPNVPARHWSCLGPDT